MSVFSFVAYLIPLDRRYWFPLVCISIGVDCFVQTKVGKLLNKKDEELFRLAYAVSPLSCANCVACSSFYVQRSLLIAFYSFSSFYRSLFVVPLFSLNPLIFFRLLCENRFFLRFIVFSFFLIEPSVLFFVSF